jgi:histidine ammonia-lyase
LPTGLTPDDGPTGGLRPLGRAFAALVAETRFLANPVSLDFRGQLAEGIEDHASMAPLAVSNTSRLVTRMYRLVALELILGAQAVDLRGGPGSIGEGPRVAYEFVRENVPVLSDETEWNVDIDGLTGQIADGLLARRVAGAVGGRPSLSEHEPPGI